MYEVVKYPKYFAFRLGKYSPFHSDRCANQLRLSLPAPLYQERIIQFILALFFFFIPSTFVSCFINIYVLLVDLLSHPYLPLNLYLTDLNFIRDFCLLVVFRQSYLKELFLFHNDLDSCLERSEVVEIGLYKNTCFSSCQQILIEICSRFQL